jgi:hypothetical protein
MENKYSVTSKLKLFRTLIILSFFVSITGCLSIKPAGVKSGKNLFEAFYVGEEGTQYFLKPLIFLNLQNNEEIYIDFTFRYKNEVKDSVLLNFTLQSKNIYKYIDSLSLSSPTITINSDDIGLLFNEKRNTFFNSRFTTKISLIEFNKMFKSVDWTIKIFYDETFMSYVPEKKTRKALKALQEKLFVLLQ